MRSAFDGLRNSSGGYGAADNALFPSFPVQGFFFALTGKSDSLFRAAQGIGDNALNLLIELAVQGIKSGVFQHVSLLISLLAGNSGGAPSFGR